MTRTAEAALNTDAVFAMIVAEWQAGRETMDIGLRLRNRLFESGCRSIPTPDEAQAHAHNVIAFHRDTVRVARRAEAVRLSVPSSSAQRSF